MIKRLKKKLGPAYREEVLLAKKLARVAGGVLIDEWGHESVSYKKGYKEKKEVVTSADLHSNEEIVEGIRARYPNHGIVSEEQASVKSESEFVWFIDPLDGTTNYVSNNEYYAVSIGLARNKEMIASVVYAPALNQFYHATRGHGAFLNGHRLRVAIESNVEEALISVGAPRQFINAQQEQIYYKIARKAKHLRWYGSIALDLAHVAAGRLHASVRASMPKPWDLAAGELLVEEAGGRATSFDGSDWNTKSDNIIAANPVLLKKIRSLIA